MPDTICFASVAELGKAYRSRDLSPVEVTKAHLKRIDRFDALLRAYISVTPEKAVEQAISAEKELRAGIDRGPFHGIPFATKDQLITRGVRTTAGSRLLNDWIPDADATAIRRLKEAGGILLGKLNMTEFALGRTEYPYGVPRNPWNVAYETGDSSSGSGSAPAAGLATIALGEDSAGSILLPAAYCGIVGFRPTGGLVSRHGLLPLAWQTDTIGPLARTAEDVAYALTTLAGHDPLDPTTNNMPRKNYAAELSQNLKGVRAAVVKELLYATDLNPEIAKAIRAATETLQDLGLSIGEVSLPMADEAAAIFMALADPQAAALHASYMRADPSRYTSSARVRLAAGLLIPGFIAHWADHVGRPIVKRQVLGALQSFDILVAPTAPVSASEIPPSVETGPMKDQHCNNFRPAIRSNGAPFALAGTPIVAVCCGFNDAGMPLSMAIAGRPLEDALVLRVAHAYQQATDWHFRRPSLA